MFFKPAVFICFFFIFFYLAISRFPYSTDTIPATYLPVVLIRGEGFDLGKIYPYLVRILPTKLDENSLPYYVIHRNGHYFSDKPIFSSLIALPIYLIPVISKNITLDNLDSHLKTIIFLGTLSASIFSAISVAFVYLSLERLTTRSKTLMLTFLYGLGTSTFSISSQQLWQHAASQMFLSASIYFFVRGQKENKSLPLTGLFLGFAVLSRFPNAIITLCYAAYILFFERKQFLRFALFSLPSLLFFAWYQIIYPGSLFFTGYENFGTGANFSGSMLLGLAGLLIAPNKGLFLYSPIFIFSIIGIYLAWKNKQKIYCFFALVALAYVLIIAKWNDWSGGWAYGPRMLVDITPFLIILITPVVNVKKIWHNRIFVCAFILLAIISVSIHLLGATVSDLSWYRLQTIFLTEEKANQAQFLWSLKYPEIYYYYLSAGGFFGVIYVFTKAFINVVITATTGFLLVFCSYLIFSLLKKRLQENQRKEYN